MTRKEFLRDREEAARNLSVASIHDIELHDAVDVEDSDLISFLYSHVALEQAVRVHASVSGMDSHASDGSD